MKKRAGIPELYFLLFLFYSLLPLPASGGIAHSSMLADLSLEELLDVEVISVTKKKQKLSESAAAIFVITQADIQRAGITSMPEALRTVPGLQVAQIDSSKWAITSRGFNGRFANKLLVLIDGRSAYTTLFSGVYWDMEETLIEDIDRIEVIRGPGAALWGSNAVNGVINIITKSAKETEGLMARVNRGTEERGNIGLRYGLKLLDRTFLRAYVKHFRRDESTFAMGGQNIIKGDSAADGWERNRGGFRLDSEGSEGSLYTLSGDIHNGTSGETLTVPTLSPPYSSTGNEIGKFSGANLLGRWRRAFSSLGEASLQLYYDNRVRDSSVLEIREDTFDMEFQNNFDFFNIHSITWGVGYRRVSDNIEGSPSTFVDNQKRESGVYSGFFQDEITLKGLNGRILLGSKVEHNSYTGYEIQPSARFIWRPLSPLTFWSSVSRAVRTPSRFESDGTIISQVLPPGVTPLPTELVLFGGRQFDSEEVLAYELGARFKFAESFKVDLASFFNRYNSLRSLTRGTPFMALSPAPHVVMPINIGNDLKAETYGVELGSSWKPSRGVVFRLSYTFLKMHILTGTSNDILMETPEGENPQNQLSLQSTVKFTKSIEGNLLARYVENLPSQKLDSYIGLDARLGIKITENTLFEVSGKNILQENVSEYTAELIDTAPTQNRRSVFITLKWQQGA